MMRSPEVRLAQMVRKSILVLYTGPLAVCQVVIDFLQHFHTAAGPADEGMTCATLMQPWHARAAI
jgi:hypothetical protein